MFETLTEKLDSVFKKLTKRGRLDEDNIQGALKEIRMALLEADVHFRVVKDFIEGVRLQAIGREVLDSITPGQQVVKIVHERLVALMGGASSQVNLSGAIPSVLLLVGLQGSGKTTTAVKLAAHLSRKERRTAMVSVDVYRPAAQEQLRLLGERAHIPVFSFPQTGEPVAICVQALEKARSDGYEVLLVDTAGRLHVDDVMMDELKRIREVVRPTDILFVADAMTGQDAVNVAVTFQERLGIDGVIMTKLDGDARGGAALSLKAVLGKPIKFIGTGEKTDAFEVFHPERMASRILGMGDVLTLVERAQLVVDEQASRKLEKKIRQNDFTLEDFRDQLQQLKKMGSLQDLVGMIPGFGKLRAMRNLDLDDKEIIRTTAIIDSMTREERRNVLILDGRRRKRIARGSGTTIQDVNRLIKNHTEMRKMMKRFGSKEGIRALRRGNFPF